MFAKWIYFVILLSTVTTINGSKRSRYLDHDYSNSDEDKPVKEKKQLLPTNTPTEEPPKNKKSNDQPNILDLINILSSFANGQKGETKISFNVRDIQSGFQNSGTKYHVGNIHRELKRERRDTDYEVLETSTTEFEGSDTSLATTSDSTTAQTSVETTNSQELATKSTTEYSQLNYDGKSTDVNIRHEVDNFQDSNATDIHDSVANDTTAAPLNTTEDNESFKVTNDSSKEVNNVSNETVSQDDDNLLQRRFLPNNNNTEASDTLNDKNELGSNANNQTTKLQLPLSNKDLSNIQNALSDDLGIQSRGAKSVANFTLNSLLESGKKTPLIVLVYNCSCGNTEKHIHDNSTNNSVNASGEIKINDTQLSVNVNKDSHLDDIEKFHTRRMLSNDDPDSEPSEVTTEDTTLETIANVQDKVDNLSNALLENELLQKCYSLLSLQRRNKLNASLDEESKKDFRAALNEAYEAITKQLSLGHNDTDDFTNYSKETLQGDLNDSNQLNDTENLDVGARLDGKNSAVVNNNETTAENDVTQEDIENHNEDKVNKGNLHTDVVSQAVSLLNDNVNTAVNTLASNIPDIRLKKRRSINENIPNFIQSSNTLHRTKRDIPNVIDRLYKYLWNTPDNSTENSSESDETKYYKLDLGNICAHRRCDVKKIEDYINSNFVLTPKHIETNHKLFKREIITARNPKYYDYLNDRPKLLYSDHINNEYDFKSFSENTNEYNVNTRIEEESRLNSLVEERELSHDSEEIFEDATKLLKMLSLMPVYINVYLQLLLKDFETMYQENVTSD